MSIDQARPDRPTLLRLDSVHKSYGDIVSLKHIDLEIEAGEFFTVLGPSGCGKSTLLRLIGGFEKPTGGVIELEGAQIQNVPPERRPFNTVFQSYALFPHMTVWDNVAYGLRVAGVAKADVARRVDEVLAMVHMADFADRRPLTMSGGQRQRVALARALVNEPEILLLDEPLGALDLKLRRTLQAELRDIHHRLGIAFVFVTHDQEEAMSLSDRICVMKDGSIEQIGTPRDLYQRPASAYVADFIGHANFLPCRVLASAEDSWQVELGVAGRAVLPAYTTDSLRVGDRALVVLRPEDLEIARPDAGGEGFEGRVVDVVYLGADVHYTVELSAGETVDVRGRDVELIGSEGGVRVRIRKGAGLIVPADEKVVPPTTHSVTAGFPEPGELEVAI